MVDEVMLVAHRAGNDPAHAREWIAAGARWVEADVHRLRGRLELRHAKAPFWSKRLHFEPWRLYRADPVAMLHEVLDVVPSGVGVMVDVKGFTPLVSRMIAEAIDHHRPVIVSSRQWYLIERFRRMDGVLGCWSIGSPAHRAAARRLVRSHRADAVAVHPRLIDHAFGWWLRGHVERVFCWALHDLQQVERLHADGVNGFICDDQALMAACAARYGSAPASDLADP